jgi:hypothetical protein
VNASLSRLLKICYKLAGITLPWEKSPPQCFTNSMNAVDAEHRFRRI